MARNMYMEFMLLVILNLSSWFYAYGKPQVPCYFIFGASTFDNGNSDRAKYSPYGIDFPSGSTGRYSNGRTPSDFVAELLGFKSYMPSFASTRGLGLDHRILQGVNYAFGGSGIRNETGKNMGVISTDGQLENHREIVSRIAAILRDEAKAAHHLRKCLYSVGTGTNDYINNYFKPQNYNTSRQFTPEQYAAVLIQELSGQLTTLYKMGARKVALFGVPPLGCAPAFAASAAGGSGANGSSCDDGVNNAIELFNLGLKGLVDTLNDDLSGAEFTVVNTFQIFSTSISGYRVTNAPCCKVLPSIPVCAPGTSPCRNRTEYRWWDGVHPTEATNRVTATRAYRSQSASDTYPFDINTLVTRKAP